MAANERTNMSPAPGLKRHTMHRLRAISLLLGLVVPQVVLMGPSFLGTRVLLPADFALGRPRVEPEAPVLFDLVSCYGSFQFVAEEYRAGRLPLWCAGSYAGSPVATTPKYSIFYLPFWLVPTPAALPYVVLFKSVVAGLGVYFCFRGVMGVGHWPAAVGAWCYPLTGFFVFWQGFPLTGTIAWFPWLLLAAHETAHRPAGWGGLALAACTGLLLISGQLDVAGQALLISGLFFLWSLFIDRPGVRLARPVGRAVLAATAGWALGLGLAAPYLLPLVEYSRTGARMHRRSTGVEERPPIGISALPEVLSPFHNGALRKGWARLRGSNELEGAGAGYAGLLAAVVAAPLAFAWRNRRKSALFFLGLALLGMSWQLDLPGVIPLLRLPGLNMMSHNRLVFATGFSLLALAVMGLEVLRQGGPGWGRACYLGVGLLVVVGTTFLERATSLITDLARISTAAKAELQHGALAAANANLQHAALTAAILCGLGALAWALLPRRSPSPWFALVLGVLLVGELIWFATGVNPQGDPGQLFPPLPILDRIRERPPGRVLGVRCLPANLNLVYGWKDVRGYDGVDPHDLVEVLDLVRMPRSTSLPYARLQYYQPLLSTDKTNRVNSPPILRMLHVRYLLFVGVPPPYVKPSLQEDDYWAIEYPDAVPRAYVPQTVEASSPGRPTLDRLAAEDFDPLRVAFVERSLGLPARCDGEAQVISDTSTRVRVAAEMKTPGLLVLADRWDEGWRAYRDGQPVPIRRTNHVLRGVELPAGHSTVEFCYEPASVKAGGWVLLASLGGLAGWACFLFARRRAASAPPD
jgi:hypothetical protein